MTCVPVLTSCIMARRSAALQALANDEYRSDIYEATAEVSF